MLGYYRNFPQLIHGKTSFHTKYSLRTLQKAIIQTLHKLNAYEAPFEEVVGLPPLSLTAKCKVNFDFGMANELTFTYLDKEEALNMKKRVRRNPFPILDFLCVIRYYKMTGHQRKRPLKFDYYFMRFAFDEGGMQVLIHHERGPQRIPPQDLLNFVIGQIKETLASKKV